MIAYKLADVVGDVCSVMLLSEDGQTLSLTASHARDPEMLAHLRTTYEQPWAVIPLHQRVLETGEPYVVPRVNRDTIREASERTLEFTERIGMHSLVMVALRAGEHALGELALIRYSPEQPAFDDQDRELAQLVADHAAVAIENARELRRRERAVLLAKEQAEGANHELEAFSYSVAHDLRAPLRAIDRFTTALENDHADQLDEDGRHCLGRVHCASRRMTHLIDDLLTLSRVTHGPLQRDRVDLTDMARTILLELAGRSSARRVESLVRDGLRATADSGLLQVLLENVLGNAWKFTGHRPVATIEVGSSADGADTVFFVRDNGAGFDMEKAEELFRPFHRLHSSAEFEGSGIGLATVQRIVGRHGGRVWVESQPDRGTTVYFTVSD